MSSAAGGGGGAYEAKITALGLALPPASKPVASYVMATRVGNLIYTGAARSADLAPARLVLNKSPAP